MILVRRETLQAFKDQFEYLADCFELIRKRGDAYNIRNEATETERMVRYSERTGFESERSHLLEIYHGIEAEVRRKEREIRARVKETRSGGTTFPLDAFVERHRLSPEELQILLVLLYNESVGRNHARFTSGNEILNLLFPNPVSALKASRYLDLGSTLLDDELIRVTSDDEAANFLRATYEVSETTLHEVLGTGDRETFKARQAASRSAQTTEGPFRIVTPRVTLDRVVMEGKLREGIEEVLWQAEEGDRLFRHWGLDQVLEKGKGTIVLFTGPPGTGKTMTAEAMAQHLGRQLYIADYAELESKWIGETEKNIVSIFSAAAQAGAVLLLDEADAILSSRLDGGHYNDRAYNRQVSILLTELEAYDGVAILTTNRSVSLDTGLARRISATFEFDVPTPQERARIWDGLLPAKIGRGPDVNLEVLANKFEMSGGHIKNAVLTAVRKAARRDGKEAVLLQRDLVEAAAAEQLSFHPCSRRIGFREAPAASYS